MRAHLVPMVSGGPKAIGGAALDGATGAGRGRGVDHRDVGLRRPEGREHDQREAAVRRDTGPRAGSDQRTAVHGGEGDRRAGAQWSSPERGTTGASVAGRTC